MAEFPEHDLIYGSMGTAQQGAIGGQTPFLGDDIPSTLNSEIEQLPDLADPIDNELFNNSRILDITFLIDAASYSSLQYNSSTYTDATMITSDGANLAVAIRLKGASTFLSIDSKASFKVKVDHFVEDQTYWTAKNFNLHNSTYDPSFMAEALSYQAYRDAGLPATRTGFATVTVNGQYKGIYSIVEKPDMNFIRQWWDDDTGSLFEAGSSQYCDFDWSPSSCWELDMDGKDGQYSDLSAFIDTVRINNNNTWLKEMKNLLYWDEFLKTMALDAVLAQWDGYGYNTNNYYMYHNPTDDKWSFIPSSTDLAWGWNPWDYNPCGNYATDPSYYTYGYIMTRCNSISSCRNEYYDKLKEMADHLDSMDIPSLIEEHKALLEPIVPYETHSGGYYAGNFNSQAACISNWASNRRDYIYANY